MLSKVEEELLIQITDSLEDNWHNISLKDIQWLVDKLYEVNKQLKIATEM
jgi:hypothetical protein